MSTRFPFRLFTVMLLPLVFVLGGGCRESSPPVPEAYEGGERVVSLAPSLTEMIVAIGAADSLVGRSSACDYPPGLLRHVPVVGGFGEPSLEALLALQPTLIVDVDLADKSLEHRLQKAGLRRERIPCSQLDDVPRALRRLGELLQRETEAEGLALTLERELDGLRLRAENISPSQRPLVFVELWPEPLMTLGNLSFISESIRLAGGLNLGDEEDAEYYYISHERVIERNPDVVLLLYEAGDFATDRIAKRIGWDSLNAVKKDRIHTDLDHDTIMRPGPRLRQGIEQLNEIIAGP